MNELPTNQLTAQVFRVLPPTHTSPETAFVVDDYPYGFRLRCKIRYWLEHDPKKGTRMCSQTSNPNIANALVWNKPKKSTYCAIAGAMFINKDSHVDWSGATHYSDANTLAAWLSDFGAGLPEHVLIKAKHILAIKREYEAGRTDGFSSGDATFIAVNVANGKLTREQARAKVLAAQQARAAAAAPDYSANTLPISESCA